MDLEQHRAAIDRLLSMQRWLIAALRESVPRVSSERWTERVAMLIRDAETHAGHLGQHGDPVETVDLTLQQPRIFDRAWRRSVNIVDPPFISRPTHIRRSIEIIDDGN